jgi:hypothetical protein
MVTGTLNVVPVGPISKTLPTAPAPGDDVGVTVMVRSLGRAPAGMTISTDPSAEAAVPPEGPTTFDEGAMLEEVSVPQQTAARTRRAQPAARRADIGVIHAR